MTNKEKALLEVMNSKDLSDESKLYLVQHITDDGTLAVDTKTVSTTDLELPDIQPRICNPEAHIDLYSQLGNNVRFTG